VGFVFNKISNRASFTLLEVLITVAILATAIIFVFRSFTASLTSAQFSQDITSACYLAEDKLWEIGQTQVNAPKSSDQGSQRIQNKDFNWYYEIQNTDNAELKELKLTVSWKEKVREKEYTMDFLTYLAPKNE